MQEIVNLLECIEGISATVIMGTVCTFLMILNTEKEEFWEKLYERYIKRDD